MDRYELLQLRTHQALIIDRLDVTVVVQELVRRSVFYPHHSEDILREVSHYFVCFPFHFFIQFYVFRGKRDATTLCAS